MSPFPFPPNDGPHLPERPGDPRGPIGDPRLLDYDLVEWEGRQASSPPGALPEAQDVRYTRPGDHLTVLAIEGGRKIGVRVGSDRNGFIPVREGDVIGPRPFDYFTVRLMDEKSTLGGALDPLQGFAHALFAVSYGPLITRATPVPGWDPGFFPVKYSVTGAGLDMLDPATVALSRLVLDPPSWFRYGGLLRLHNRSLSDPVYFYEGSPTQFAATGVAVATDVSAGADVTNFGWRIDPGQKEEFYFRSGMRALLKVQGFNLGVRTLLSRSLFLQTTGATVEVSALFSSSARDNSDKDSTISQAKTPFGWGQS